MPLLKCFGPLIFCAVLLAACVVPVSPAAPAAEPQAGQEPASPSTDVQSPQDSAAREVLDADGNLVVIDDLSRIITLGGPVTEIVFALGSGENVVAVDSSSSYPSSVTELPQVGYQRRLSAEGVLALNPSVILATTEAGPAEAIQQLRDSGVAVLLLESEDSEEGVERKVRALAQALGRDAEGEALIGQIQSDLDEARAFVQASDIRPKVMFIYARGAGAVSVAGLNTGAHVMIDMAGGVNAVTEFEDYRPLTAEAAIAAEPDVILMFTSGLQSLGGNEGLLALPGIAQTPAAESGHIVAMDGLYLLNFGPRMGEAALELAQRIRESH